MKRSFKPETETKYIGVLVPKSYFRKIQQAALDADMNRADFLRLAIHNAVINGLPNNLPPMVGVVKAGVSS